MRSQLKNIIVDLSKTISEPLSIANFVKEIVRKYPTIPEKEIRPVIWWVHEVGEIKIDDKLRIMPG